MWNGNDEGKTHCEVDLREVSKNSKGREEMKMREAPREKLKKDKKFLNNLDNTDSINIRLELSKNEDKNKKWSKRM